MARRHTKEEAIRIVTDCAAQYREALDGYSLLFLCQDKHRMISSLECSFSPGNFLHLTGLKTRPAVNAKEVDNNEHEYTGAIDFYNRCLNHHLSAKDFEFATDGTTDLKLDVLPGIINKSLSARMIGNYEACSPQLYTEKLAGGTKACVGFVRDRKTGVYVPNTVLKEDIRDRTCGYARVIVVYRKKATEEQYTEMTYAAKKVDWGKIHLPVEYQYLVSR